MLRKVTVDIPAKINLTLDIVGKREDGYHFLKTVMQSVGLYDTVSVALCDSGRITVQYSRPDIPTGEAGLCHRAAAAFFDYTGLPLQGVEIAVQCDIPTEGGLGSASADAAGVLVGLNSLYRAGLQTDDLCRLGVTLGADVPFGIVGGAVLAEGIGEIFTPLSRLPDCAIVIAKPQLGVKTAECFATYDKMGSDKIPHTQRLIAALEHGDLAEAAGCLCNVLERACRVPQVEQLKALLLEHGALGASMSGSGTSVFGLFEKAHQAKKAAEALRHQAAFVTVTGPVAEGARVLE